MPVNTTHVNKIISEETVGFLGLSFGEPVLNFINMSILGFL